MNNLYFDTIIAPATIPGTGAISVIRISGPDSLKLVDEVVSIKSGTASQSDGYTIKFGTVSTPDGGFLDEVLVSIFKAPHSYTGEDSAELSCHASSYIVTEIVDLFLNVGARYAEPGEFTKRAFMNGKMDLAQAEAVADIISSTTSTAHRVAANQLRGGFSKELGAIRSELLEMTSLLELELDFSEEDVEFAGREKLAGLISDAIHRLDILADSFHKGNAIRNGIPVAIAGAANAGKSTLLNALLKEDRAIVSDVAGTTRDTIEEVVNIGGLPFRFIDTAGLRRTEESVEKLGIERSFKKISEAEIVLFVIDLTLSDFDLLNSIRAFLPLVDLSSQHLILVLNKTDLLLNLDYNKKVNSINNYVINVDNKIDTIIISAKNEIGIEKLKERLFSLEKELIPTENSSFVTNQRHYSALRDASGSLSAAARSLSSEASIDLVAEDLRMALDSLGSITGEVTSDEILGEIFGRFCIGK